MDHLLIGQSPSAAGGVAMNGMIATGTGGTVKFARNHTAFAPVHNHALEPEEEMLPAYHAQGHNHGPSMTSSSMPAHHHHHIHHQHFPDPAHFAAMLASTPSENYPVSSAGTPCASSEPAPYYVRQPPLPPPVPTLPPQYHQFHNHIPLERVESQKSLFSQSNGHSHQPTPASAEPQLKNPKKSSLKKRSKFDTLTRSTQSLTNLVATSGGFSTAGYPNSQQQRNKPRDSSMGIMPSFNRKRSSSTVKHVEIVNFSLKGGPPWGFRIKQRNDNVFISKVSTFFISFTK